MDPGCFLGAGIRIPAYFRIWDDDPSGVLGYWNPWVGVRVVVSVESAPGPPSKFSTGAAYPDV